MTRRILDANAATIELKRFSSRLTAVTYWTVRRTCEDIFPGRIPGCQSDMGTKLRPWTPFSNRAATDFGDEEPRSKNPGGGGRDQGGTEARASKRAPRSILEAPARRHTIEKVLIASSLEWEE